MILLFPKKALGLGLASVKGNKMKCSNNLSLVYFSLNERVTTFLFAMFAYSEEAQQQ